MKLIYKLFKLDSDSRTDIISATSILNIVVNAFIALAKVVIGVFTSSIAILTEGINNATDALTSVLTLAGSKLAGKKPDEKHPFGYGRVEYLTSLAVSGIIIVAGVESGISSIKLVFNPEPLEVSYMTAIIVAITAVIKLLLGFYTIAMGKKADSKALEAVGIECRSDSLISVITIIVTLVYLIFGFSIDAYAGILTSAIIVKAGAEVFLETVSELIGRPGESDLATQIYKEVRATEGVISAADMMLHNYGPESWSGSVNIEMDHDMTVGEIYQIIHQLQLRIMHELKVTMVFGIYAVDNDHEDSKILRRQVADFVTSTDHVKSFHAVYIDPDNKDIYCDLIVDYKLDDWDSLREKFLNYMNNLYPERHVELTIETEFV